MNKTLLAASLGLLLASGAANAADVKLINLDSEGVGLNDTTPAAPIGNNPGTTRGEQALIVYQFAMDMWGGVLESDQTINIYASFAPLTCTATGGTLAQAGANWTFNLTSDGVTRRYGSALADALTGIDLFEYFKSLGQIPAPYLNDYGDIFSQFNGSLGSPGCLDGMSWYFGLDGNTPTGQVNFLNVVMHEIGHGLGAQSFINKSTGAFSSNISDPYAQRAYSNLTGKSFEDPTMTNAMRALAMRSPGATVWTGSNVNANAALILNARNALQPTAPAAIAGKQYEVGYAAFGPLAGLANFPNQPLVLINDGNLQGTTPTNGTTSDGCGPNGSTTTAGDTLAYVNAAAVAGKVAVIDRGTCSFEYKAKIAQDNGAVGVVILNNAFGVIDMGRALVLTTGLTIPTVMVSQADGLEIKANLAGATAGLVGSGYLQGADNAGRTRLYAPATVAPGSTFSHFDSNLLPDVLMEPFDSPTVQAQINVDLTPALFADIGWTLNPGNAKIGNCTTNVDVVQDGGLVPGANVQAWSNVCEYTSGGRKGAYQSCMDAYKERALAAGILVGNQGGKVMSCAARKGK